MHITLHYFQVCMEINYGHSLEIEPAYVPEPAYAPVPAYAEAGPAAEREARNPMGGYHHMAMPYMHEEYMG